MKLKIASFNIENLFTRFNFEAFTDERARSYLPQVVQFFHDFDAGNIESFNKFKGLVETAEVVQTDEKRQHTALAMAETDADIICMQEVDGIAALRKFQDVYLSKTTTTAYYQAALHEGNDPRGIDNAVLAVEKVASKDVLIYTRSNAHMRVSHLKDLANLVIKYPAIAEEVKNKGRRIFARDCLEVDVHADGKVFTLFVCHFKSMSGGGHDETVGRRQLEALAVRQIIERRFANPAQANWVVLGDLNDYWRQIRVSSVLGPTGVFAETVREEHLDPGFKSGLDPFLRDGFAVSLVDALPVEERWSHYYSTDRTKTQLDHMLASPQFAASVLGLPRFIRGGQPIRVPNTKTIERYPRVGWDRPKASDHCPLVVEIETDRLN
jgi:predicted extracellular nuclease